MGRVRLLGRSRFWRVFGFLALAILGWGIREWRLPALSGIFSTPARSSFQPIQFNPREELAAGKFLVASRRLGDPNFSQSVILLVHYSSRAAAGVIINRPTKVPLSRALEEMAEAKGRTEPLYLGGPVGESDVMALLRSNTAPPDGARVLGDVYMISSKGLLQKTLAAGSTSSTLRVFFGYSGWGAGQLDAEVGLGAWVILPGDPALVFDAHPETVWDRLMNKLNQKLALDAIDLRASRS